MKESLDIIMEKMKKSRKIFHSEDDFKFSLAWLIKEVIPECDIRLEKPETIEMITRDQKNIRKRVPIDIVLSCQNTINIPLELKYKTKKLNIKENGEEYRLKTHGADDVGRFSFRKDIFRIEKYLEKRNSPYGYVIILTNESKYLLDISNKNKLDSHYSFHEGFEIKQEDKGWNYSNINKQKYEHDSQSLKWIYKNKANTGKQKEHWSCKGEYFYKLDLAKSYTIKWNNYSNLQGVSFEYCMLKIESLRTN